MMTLFTEPAERAKAMGVFGFVAAGGGSIGVLLGGVLTDVLDWHWIFLVNVPIGDRRLRPDAAARALGPSGPRTGSIDVAGAVTVTAALMLAVYAIVNGNEAGWLSAQTLGLLAAAAVAVRRLPRDRVARLDAARAARLFRLRNVCDSNVVGVLWAAAMFAWFFLSALYLQLVLGYSPLEVGLAFLPGEPDHGRALGRALGEARDALRHPDPARRRALARRDRAAPLRPRAGRRQLRRRRAPER